MSVPGRPRSRDPRGQRPEDRVEALRRAGDEDPRALADPQLLRERRAGVVLVSLGHPAMVVGGEPGTIARVGGILFLVGTPIGNLGDLSDRARETLASVALVAAEDTRRTGRLLRGLDIRKPLVSMFEGNEDERAVELLERLDAGEDVAVVTDGGMPASPIPATGVVQLAVEAASTCASSPARRPRSPRSSCRASRPIGSSFEGFLPQASRRSRADARGAARTIREPSCSSSRRAGFTRSFARWSTSLGDRRVAVPRADEAARGGRPGPAEEVLAELGDPSAKGEIVLVVEGDHDPDRPESAELLAEVRGLVEDGMRTRDAARAVAERHGASANELYRARSRRLSSAPFAREAPSLHSLHVRGFPAPRPAAADPVLGPDQPEPAAARCSRPSCIGFFLAIVLGVLAVVSLLQDPADLIDLAGGSTLSPILAADRSPTPSLDRPTFAAGGRGRVPVPGTGRGSARPMGPLRADHVRVEHGRGSSPVRPDLRDALRRVTRATGIRFRPVGVTKEYVHRRVQTDAIPGRDPQGSAHPDLGRPRDYTGSSVSFGTPGPRSRSPRRWPACTPTATSTSAGSS